ncbi:YncE family protein [Rummeliibacillus pycnus]|uniref:YncE family protein n=1 Tax=Rummeliibacillus pycnus TaxID=101070 RepID=UPI003D28DC5A
MRWRKLIVLSLLSFVLILTGCGQKNYPAISNNQDFIASVNIQAPSISFINDQGKVFSTWQLEEGYTGATLINQQQILLYGFQLKKAVVYSLTTGKQLYSIDTGVGVTNAIYDEIHNQIYIANGKTNRVAAYNEHGKLMADQKVYNYPMAMLIHDNQLFVVNYKDTKLSILQTKSLKPLKEWTIEKSSNGMVVVNDDQLWLGGHGEGIKPNSTVDIFNLESGKKISQIKMPMMPVGFVKNDNRVYVISHGDSVLSEVTLDGKIKHEWEIGANPFSVNVFKNFVAVAGYDDHHIYFLQNGKIVKTINVGKGPFQLLVREGS